MTLTFDDIVNIVEQLSLSDLIHLMCEIGKMIVEFEAAQSGTAQQ